MLLSEMFGVERETDFGVEGYAGTFKIILHCNGAERLMSKYPGESFWQLAKSEIICTVIRDAPDNIIHLPPPLTDEQREQLKAIWTLGGRWLAMDADGMVYAYAGKPSKKTDLRYFDWIDGGLFSVLTNLKICSLVSWSDTEPYDIGKALGIKR